MLLDLYAADVEYSAEALEDVYHGLEIVGKQVLSKQTSDDDAATMLTAIAHEEDLNGLIRRNVQDTRRAGQSSILLHDFIGESKITDAEPGHLLAEEVVIGARFVSRWTVTPPSCSARSTF